MNRTQRPSAAGALFRWLAGLVIIGVMTLGAAYYVPLYRAHKELTRDYELATQKRDAEAQNILRLETELKAVTASRDELQAKNGKAEAEESKVRDRAGKLESDVAEKLSHSVSKGFVQVVFREGNVAVDFAATLMKSPDDVEVTPAGSATVCEAVRALETSGVQSVRVVTYATTAAATSPTDAWTSGSARATAVARVLSEKCHYVGAKIAAVSVLAAPDSKASPPPAFELAAASAQH